MDLYISIALWPTVPFRRYGRPYVPCIPLYGLLGSNVPAFKDFQSLQILQRKAALSARGLLVPACTIQGHKVPTRSWHSRLFKACAASAWVVVMLHDFVIHCILSYLSFLFIQQSATFTTRTRRVSSCPNSQTETPQRQKGKALKDG